MPYIHYSIGCLPSLLFNKLTANSSFGHHRCMVSRKVWTSWTLLLFLGFWLLWIGSSDGQASPVATLAPEAAESPCKSASSVPSWCPYISSLTTSPPSPRIHGAKRPGDLSKGPRQAEQPRRGDKRCDQLRLPSARSLRSCRYRGRSICSAACAIPGQCTGQTWKAYQWQPEGETQPAGGGHRLDWEDRPTPCCSYFQAEYGCHKTRPGSVRSHNSSSAGVSPLGSQCKRAGGQSLGRHGSHLEPGPRNGSAAISCMSACIQCCRRWRGYGDSDIFSGRCQWLRGEQFHGFGFCHDAYAVEGGGWFRSLDACQVFFWLSHGCLQPGSLSQAQMESKRQQASTPLQEPSSRVGFVGRALVQASYRANTRPTPPTSTSRRRGRAYTGSVFPPIHLGLCMVSHFPAVAWLAALRETPLALPATRQGLLTLAHALSGHIYSIDGFGPSTAQEWLFPLELLAQEVPLVGTISQVWDSMALRVVATMPCTLRRVPDEPGL